MAFSLETSGYQFAPAFPRTDDAQALAGVKPLSFSGGGQSPLQFQPLAGWATPSTHPEYVTQGIASGLGDIAKGISAAYKSKSDRKREDELLKQKYAQEEKLAKIRGDISTQLLQERIDAAGGNLGSKSKNLPVSVLGASTQTPDDSESSAEDTSLPDLEKYKGNSFAPPTKDFNLPENLQGEAPYQQKVTPTSNLFGDLSAPVPVPPAELQGNAALSALSSIPWGSVSGQYKSAGGVPQQAYAPNADLLRNPSKALANMSTFGKSGNIGTDSGRAAVIDALAKGWNPNAVPKDPAIEQMIGMPVAVSQEDFRKIEKYAKAQGIEPPIAEKEQMDGSVVMKWPQLTPEQKVMEKSRQDKLSFQEKNREEAGFKGRAHALMTTPEGKAIQSRLDLITQFWPAADAALDTDPNDVVSRRVADLDAIDKFVNFASGKQPTEAQYHQIQDYTQGFLRDIRQKIDKGVSGARLSPEDVMTMKSMMGETFNYTSQRFNARAKNARKQALHDRPDLPEGKRPHEFPLLRTGQLVKSEFDKETNKFKALHEQLVAAKTPEEKQDLQDKYDAQKEQLSKIASEMAQIKANKGNPSNMDELLNPDPEKVGGWQEENFSVVPVMISPVQP